MTQAFKLMGMFVSSWIVKEEAVIVASSQPDDPDGESRPAPRAADKVTSLWLCCKHDSDNHSYKIALIRETMSLFLGWGVY